MAKVYGIHEIVLHPGVNEEEFVRFFHQEYKVGFDAFGWNLVLLKGDRGQRAEKYALLFEIRSLDARARFSPGPNESSKEMQEWNAEHKEYVDALNAKWATFSPSDPGSDPEYTDYVELE